jgi:dihydroneopterin aldolase
VAKISIVDLEVFYHVGVPDEERSRPQRLLLTLELESDFAAAGRNDSIADTVDYYAVTQRLLKFGEGRSWKLIEKVAADIGEAILADFKVSGAFIEVKKFIIPQARYVSVSMNCRTT